jgi:hypothetical protein
MTSDLTPSVGQLRLRPARQRREDAQARDTRPAIALQPTTAHRWVPDESRRAQSALLGRPLGTRLECGVTMAASRSLPPG